MTIDHSAAITRIDTVLKAVSSPNFQAVYAGEPVTLPASGAQCAFWYVGDSPYAGGKTLGNVMISEQFVIRAYFTFKDAPQLRQSIEALLWDACRNIKAGLYGDADLNSLVTDLDVGDASVEWMTLNSGGVKRIVTMTLMLHDTEAESISA